ncbi:MAG TPA: hypothetical protein VIJ99_03550, partial [Acidimicrobiales bacterium]
MLNLLGDFIGELRSAGIPVSMSEHVDSAKAMEVIDLSDRALVRNSLAATLVKDGDHLAVFNTAFEVFFSTRSWESAAEFMDDADTSEMDREGAAGSSGPGQSRGEGGGSSSSLSAQELAELLFRALRDSDMNALRQAASESVTRYAGMEPGRPVGGTYYLYRTLRNLDLENLEQRLTRGGSDVDDHLAERLAREEAKARIEQLKAEIERVI